MLGSVSSVVLSSTSPVDAFEVSISGDSAVDRDRLFDRADLEHDVEREELLRADACVLALEGLEAGDRRLDGVDAGRHAGNEYSPAALVTVSRDTPDS